MKLFNLKNKYCSVNFQIAVIQKKKKKKQKKKKNNKKNIITNKI